MFRQMLIIAFALTVSQGTIAASSQEIDARVRSALQTLYETFPAGKELSQSAKGILVFPGIIKAGFGVGGEYGEGALLVNGSAVQYYKLTALSVGFQVGGQAKNEVLMFMTESALQQFRASEGWEAGVDGSVAIVEFGVGKDITTNNARDPIIGFVYGNKGLMYDLSIEGSKFWKTDK
ncbi:MAG: hypothetical protein KUG75_05600 [Pseudomonadales bacterium]|nr:hypothetical protein [Pseudomonadales bacterium]